LRSTPRRGRPRASAASPAPVARRTRARRWTVRRPARCSGLVAALTRRAATEASPGQRRAPDAFPLVRFVRERLRVTRRRERRRRSHRTSRPSVERGGPYQWPIRRLRDVRQTRRRPSLQNASPRPLR
jgi:hypothetical protein